LMGLFGALAAAATQAPPPPVWGVFSNGYAMSFVADLILFVLMYVMIQRARAGLPVPAIRKLPGLDAIDEAIGRATEMGRPVHITPGLSDVTDARTLAEFMVASHVAKQCARYDTRLISTLADITQLAVQDEVVREAYLEAGKPEAYNPDDTMFLSNDQFGYASGIIGLFRRERPAASILYGEFAAEAMILIENGAQVGAVQVGATTNVYQLPFFVAGCDFTLIGEEMFAASAYLSKEPVLTGSVIGQDWSRALIFLVIVLGLLLTNVAGPKHNVLANWLKL
jgi:hypothetical protein